MIKLKDLINEASDKDVVKSRLNLSNLEDIQVGRSKMQAYLVDYNLLYKEMSTPSKRNMDKLIEKGARVIKSYVRFQMQKDFSKEREIMTWVIFMEDWKGNDIVFYKYEGPTVGGGQNYIYFNDSKMKLVDYLSYELNTLIKDKEQLFQKFFSSIDSRIHIRCHYNENLKGFIFTFYIPGLSNSEAISIYDKLEENYDKIIKLFDDATTINHIIGYDKDEYHSTNTYEVILDYNKPRYNLIESFETQL